MSMLIVISSNDRERWRERERV